VTDSRRGAYWRELQSVFDAIADEFDRTRQRPWREVAAFTSRLRPEAYLLDVGCGNGRHMIPHLENGGRVLGVDVSSRLLAAAGRNLARHREWALVIGVATELPVPPGAFDAVICTATLHHIPSDADRLVAVNEIRRVLRPGGVGLLSCWALEQDRFSHLDSQDTEVPWVRVDGSAVMRFYHLFREGELESLVKRAGLTVDRSFRSGDNYYVELSKGD
jgi:ubiquinone/menaquinone biosynthesis C-methylase UbiE